MDSLRVLDLGCGVGGVSCGYHRAGFSTVGIDLVWQPNYPYGFRQGDALAVMEGLLDGKVLAQVTGAHTNGISGPSGHYSLGDFDLIHASMPCQRWSKQVRCRPELRERYPDLITPLRPLLEESGLPYVLENVEGAPLRDPITLCGWSFGRQMYRHRLLEAGGGITVAAPQHRPHDVPASRAGHWEPGTFFSMAGHVAPMWKAREVMDIAWGTREELAEAIPPYMIEYAALQIRAQLMVSHARDGGPPRQYPAHSASM